ncbi:MAG: P1 family peptidase [Firmicutes bacterium]|nr:P1 family peptidase [Bacillota bacterium]
MKEINLTKIEGIKIGHAQDMEAATGCTVILCEKGGRGGVDVRGGSPGTRETDLLNPMNLIDGIHGILLAGGSAFGLDASAGVMSHLEERGCGFDAAVTRVPIVVGAVLFDLHIGDFRIRPGKEMGYQACKNASTDECPEGNVGAGTGATVGKFLGMERAMKGGLGTCCFRVGELEVGAIMAVNCLGDVVDPATGKIVAGTLDDDGLTFADTEQLFIELCDRVPRTANGNTIIGAVVTNANLSKSGANRLAMTAQNGIGHVIRPAHTLYDGDTIFALSTCKIDADLTTVGLLAVRAVENSILRAVRSATSLCNIKSVSDLCN